MTLQLSCLSITFTNVSTSITTHFPANRTRPARSEEVALPLRSIDSSFVSVLTEALDCPNPLYSLASKSPSLNTFPATFLVFFQDPYPAKNLLDIKRVNISVLVDARSHQVNAFFSHPREAYLRTLLQKVDILEHKCPIADLPTVLLFSKLLAGEVEVEPEYEEGCRRSRRLAGLDVELKDPTASTASSPSTVNWDEEAYVM